MSAVSCYGGCAWEAFGPAGFQVPGSPTCAQLPPKIVWRRSVAAPANLEYHTCPPSIRPKFAPPPTGQWLSPLCTQTQALLPASHDTTDI
ncbi:hypothetical protein E8E78_15880 [Pseudomonas sp. BN505]|nr:hypothetical protein [Pseudomonas sp. BN605]MDH4858060.1 hypothetical protein [Pseudomonas sp. BN505]